MTVEGKLFSQLTEATNISGSLGVVENASTGLGKKFTYSNDSTFASSTDAMVSTSLAVSTALAGKSDAITPSENLIYYVSAVCGDDSTGDGSYAKPFATLMHTMSMITDSGKSKWYTIQLLSDINEDNGPLLVKPFVWIFGQQIYKTEVNIYDGIKPSSGHTVTSLNGFKNISFSDNVLWELPVATESVYNTVIFENCTFFNLLTAEGRDSSIGDYVRLYNCGFSNSVELSNVVCIARSCEFELDVSFVDTETTNNKAQIELSNSVIEVSVTVDNATVSLRDITYPTDPEGLDNFTSLNTCTISSFRGLPATTACNFSSGSTIHYYDNATMIRYGSTNVDSALDDLYSQIAGVVNQFSSDGKAFYVAKFGDDLAEQHYYTLDQGIISSSSDFPTTAEVADGDCYMVAIYQTVTDNDSSKTNTGQTFSGPVQIAWYAKDSKWIERNGLTPETCLCSIGAAQYIANYLYQYYAKEYCIICLDSSSYYFESYEETYVSVFAPLATFHIYGYYYFKPNTGIMSIDKLYSYSSNGFYGMSTAASHLYVNFAQLSSSSYSGLFFKSGSGEFHLHANKIDGQSTANQVISCLQSGGDAFYVYANKIIGTIYSLGDSIYVNTLDLTDIVQNPLLGSIYINGPAGKWYKKDERPALTPQWFEFAQTSSISNVSFNFSAESINVSTGEKARVICRTALDSSGDLGNVMYAIEQGSQTFAGKVRIYKDPENTVHYYILFIATSYNLIEADTTSGTGLNIVNVWNSCGTGTDPSGVSTYTLLYDSSTDSGAMPVTGTLAGPISDVTVYFDFVRGEGKTCTMTCRGFDSTGNGTAAAISCSSLVPEILRPSIAVNGIFQLKSNNSSYSSNLSICTIDTSGNLVMKPVASTTYTITSGYAVNVPSFTMTWQLPF